MNNQYGRIGHWGFFLEIYTGAAAPAFQPSGNQNANQKRGLLARSLRRINLAPCFHTAKPAERLDSRRAAQRLPFWPVRTFNQARSASKTGRKARALSVVAYSTPRRHLREDFAGDKTINLPFTRLHGLTRMQ